MEFLAQTGQWDAKDQAAVHKWFQDYLQWLTTDEHSLDEKTSGTITRPGGQHRWPPWQPMSPMTRAKDGLGLVSRADSAAQIRPDGSARARAAHQSLSYSAFNLEAMVMTCRIAQVNGVDLWNVKTKSGATISTVIDYLQPYLTDPKKWAKDQIANS